MRRLLFILSFLTSWPALAGSIQGVLAPRWLPPFRPASAEVIHGLSNFAALTAVGRRLEARAVELPLLTENSSDPAGAAALLGAVASGYEGGEAAMERDLAAALRGSEAQQAQFLRGLVEAHREALKAVDEAAAARAREALAGFESGALCELEARAAFEDISKLAHFMPSLERHALPLRLAIAERRARQQARALQGLSGLAEPAVAEAMPAAAPSAAHLKALAVAARLEGPSASRESAMFALARAVRDNPADAGLKTLAAGVLLEAVGRGSYRRTRQAVALVDFVTAHGPSQTALLREVVDGLTTKAAHSELPPRRALPLLEAAADAALRSSEARVRYFAIDRLSQAVELQGLDGSDRLAVRALISRVRSGRGPLEPVFPSTDKGALLNFALGTLAYVGAVAAIFGIVVGALGGILLAVLWALG